MIRSSVRRGHCKVAWLGALVVLACHTPNLGDPIPRLSTADSTGRPLVAASVARIAPARIAPATKGQLPDERRQVDQVIRLVSRLRGWPELAHIQVDEASTTEFGQWLSIELAAQIPESVARFQDRNLSLLGLLPAQFDSSRAVLGALSDTIQGAYLSTRGQIVLRRGLTPDAIWAILAHEIAHAYEDQLYALGSKLRYQARQGDESAALHAFAEGEACHVEFALARADFSSNEADFSDERFEEQLSALGSRLALPSVLKRGIVAPYLDGYRFVSYLRRVGNWELVDAVWRRGLANTSELLHPERWIDPNVGPLTRPDPKLSIVHRGLKMDKDSEVVWEESLGEQGLRILLEEIEPAAQAATLASTWRDDTIWSLRSDTGERLAWHVRTDGHREAVLLERALRRLLHGNGRSAPPCRSMLAASVVLVVQNRDILVVASGQSETGAGHLPRVRCRELVNWGRETLAAISLTH